jgi:DNA-binding FadR family transcriptional regulator
VVEAVLASIRAGELAPGARLPSDRELSERLQVSRLTAREGLLALELTGVIDVRPGAGAFVRSTTATTAAGTGLMVLPTESERSPRELIEARIALEPAIVRTCIAHTTEAQLDELRAVIARAQAEVDGDLDEFVRLGLGFHTELAARCGNAFLATFCRSLVSVSDHPLWTLLNRHAVRTGAARQGQVDEHRRIVEAIAARDEEAASAAMAHHLHGLEEVVFGG